MSLRNTGEGLPLPVAAIGLAGLKQLQPAEVGLQTDAGRVAGQLAGQAVGAEVLLLCPPRLSPGEGVALWEASKLLNHGQVATRAGWVRQTERGRGERVCE